MMTMTLEEVEALVDLYEIAAPRLTLAERLYYNMLFKRLHESATANQMSEEQDTSA